jgi:outer membrane protein assembly factor BamB
LIAIDQKTGKTVWREPRDEQARSYSTPVIWSRGGDNNTEIIVAGSLQLAAYDATSGKKVWWVNGLSRIVDSTPVVTKDAIYLATWTPGGDVSERIKMEPFDEAIADMDKNKDNKISKNELPAGSPVIPRFFRMDLDQDQSLNQKEWERHAGVFAKAQNVAMSVRPGGRGDVTSTHVRWIVRRGLPTVPSSTVYDGVLYMVKDSGIITSLDIDTGEILQQGRAEGSGNYYASLVAGDGKVYLTSERGVITVLRASRSWTVLSSHDFEERIVATPVAKQQTFFVRTEEALYAFRKR